jgi:plasmid stabilization system protein ParE
MLVRFLEPAENELDEARDYYNAQRPGLGDEFLVEVLLTLERIQAYPAAWPHLSRQTRRCRTRRFPYGVVYRATQDEILIVAVAHLHRRPLYWAERIKTRS